MTDKPLDEDELRDQIARSRIVLAETTAIDVLSPYVSKILAALKDFGFSSIMVSDDSCFSDFSLSGDELMEIGDKLGVRLDPANEDDWWIVKVAAKMARVSEA